MQPATSSLALTVERDGQTAIVICTGRLVSGVSDRLSTQVKELIPECKRIVLDLKDCTHMDSMGLGTVVRLYVSAKSAGCALELMNIGKPVRNLLGVTHLISVLAIVGENNIRF
jgi:anti-sigma B factor antagonist